MSRRRLREVLLGLAALGLGSALAQAQVITEFSAGITAASTSGIAAGPDGNLWFTEEGNDQIGRITPLGAVTEFGSGISVGASPREITTGPDGNLWFTERSGDRIGRITPLGVVTEFSAGISLSAFPWGITSGPDGNLWFTESQSNRIGLITPLGVVTEFNVGISLSAQPQGITSGPDGNLWFTEFLGNRIGRITPLGVVTEFSTGISPSADPYGITPGPDGNLWFTEYTGHRIGRITPLGVVTEFSTGITAGAEPQSIASGPDGKLWFTEFNAGRIGRVSLGEAGEAFYTLSPCRVLDTRNTPDGPLAGPALQAGATRTFDVVASPCGIPSTALAVSVNLTAIGAAAPGYLTLFPGNDATPPLASNVNFTPGVTRANNAVVRLATDASGTINVKNGSAGTVHFVLDVNGYFQ